MKSLNELELSAIKADEKIKRGISSVLNNSGRAVAIITALVTALATFTDIAFSGAPANEAFPSLLLMLTSSYVIFFSLLDAGEKLGEESENYKQARKRYLKAIETLPRDGVEQLRDFLDGYSKKEYEARRRRAMLSLGITEEDIATCKEAGQGSKKIPRDVRRAVMAVNRIRPAPLSVKSLMSSEPEDRRGELENPARGRIPTLILKLLPSTFCMLITISLILSLKDGLTVEAIINGLLKLSALPLIGFRGYSEGYRYSKTQLSTWLNTKASIIESFVSTLQD